MADNNSGDKTEQPTPKKLKDARKKGDVPKSKDVTSTAVLILWLILFAFGLDYTYDQIVGIANQVFAVPDQDFSKDLARIGWAATKSVLALGAIFLVPVILFALAVEYLQTGPILTFEKIKPKLSHINPVEGIKKLFSMDNLIEVFKAVLKTGVLFLLAWIVIRQFIPELIMLPRTSLSVFGEAMYSLAFKLLILTVGIFALFALLDAIYQHFSFMKKNRMSKRDIKQEFKDMEGDPMIKQQRRQTHQEWADQGAMHSARTANALLVNPTHIAIAISYDKDKQPVPKISAMAVEHLAKAMREEAEKHNVPIIRNIEVARAIKEVAQEGDPIPGEFFDVVAEIILWAQEVREQIQQNNRSAARKYKPPGKDLTRYPFVVSAQ